MEASYAISPIESQNSTCGNRWSEDFCLHAKERRDSSQTAYKRNVTYHHQKQFTNELPCIRRKQAQLDISDVMVAAKVCFVQLFGTSQKVG